MNTNIWNDLKNLFLHPKNALDMLLVINVAVFLLVSIVKTVFFLLSIDPTVFSSLIHWLSLPASFSALLFQPWSIFTYMFLHQGFFHLLFNMLWLYWLGRIFIDFLNHKKLTTVYILGGIGGGLIYMVLFNLFPVFSNSVNGSYLLGASAGVLAVVVATATLVPEYTIRLLFIGNVKLKHIALFSILLDIISIGNSNPGGHIAHLGGALVGFIYIKQLQKGNDFGQKIGNFFSGFTNMFNKKDPIKVVHKQTVSKPKSKTAADQKTIDGILDKISESGYDSLSVEEKRILFQASED
ncbi:MAG: membrane associated rhomboid family serine protease [Sphingobacteriales bacterium]|jgi:membrane associated rhomboid family serine protease